MVGWRGRRGSEWEVGGEEGVGGRMGLSGRGRRGLNGRLDREKGSEWGVEGNGIESTRIRVGVRLEGELRDG